MTTAPKPAKPGLFGRRPDAPPAADEPTPLDEPVSEETPEPTLGEEPHHDPVEAGASEPVRPEDAWSQGDPVTDPGGENASDAAARFDLGLEPSESAWEPTAVTDAPATDFGLVAPANDAPASDEPAYVVTEPTLSDRFVGTAAPGRPDHSTPQLRDPLPMLSLDEDTTLDDHRDPSSPMISIEEAPPVAETGSEGPDTAEDATDTPAESLDEPRGFRLPGLSLFARSRGAHEARGAIEGGPDSDAAGTDAPEVVAAPTAFVEPRVEQAPAETPDEVWSEASVESAQTNTMEPTEEIVGEAVDGAFGQQADELPATRDAAPATSGESDTAPHIGNAAVPTNVGDPFADEAAEAGLDTVGTHLAPIPDALGVAGEEVADEADQPVGDAPETDDVEIELIEPDLTEYVDVETLYVTEEATEGPSRTTLVTVDEVPGAEVSRALDVVTAVASASTADDIAGAVDRAMEQLREKATDLGGRAVIAVRSEVQEIGVGFLVIASGTAVELT